jgi:hypothetical protein
MSKLAIATAPQNKSEFVFAQLYVTSTQQHVSPTKPTIYLWGFYQLWDISVRMGRIN